MEIAARLETDAFAVPPQLAFSATARYNNARLDLESAHALSEETQLAAVYAGENEELVRAQHSEGTR